MKTFLKILIVSFFIFIIGSSLGGLYNIEKNDIDLNNDINFKAPKRQRQIQIQDNIITPIQDNIASEYTSLEEAFKKSNRKNIVILGMEGARTDTIIFSSVCMDTKKIDLISIPRDTYIHRKGKDLGEQRKINSVYQDHGVEGLETTISHILVDVPIHHYIKLDYESVKKIVDSVDGVEVDVPFDMKYEDISANPPLDIDIKRGIQNLNGKNALDFLRYRKGNNKIGYIDGDIGRIKAQQSFLKNFAKKAIKNPLNTISNTIKYIDTDIKFLDGINYGRKLIGINSEDITFEMIAGSAELRDINKRIFSYFIYDREEIKIKIEKMYNVKKI